MNAESKSSFERLSAVNVSAHIEKKNGLSYLSWAWALDQLMRQDPNAEWEYQEPQKFGETMMVFCTVRAFGKARTAFLPVMDYKNKPIPNPDAFAVNTAMQRCLVKAIALHGLGLYIYAGEDLPEGAKDERIEDKIVAANVQPNAGAGEVLTLERRGKIDRLASCVIDCFEAGTAEEAYDAIAAFTLDTDDKTYLWSLLDSKMRSTLKKIGAERKKAALQREEATQP